MKRFFAFVLTLLMILSFAACSERNTPPDQIDESPETMVTTQPVDSLAALRAEMKPPIMAVLDFGFPELSDEFDVMEYLEGEYPNWLEENNYIRDIPKTRIVRTCGYDAWAELMCIVPRDPMATVCVNVTRYMEEEPYEELGTEVVYRSESGDPILLLADVSDNIIVTVNVTNSEGRGVSWMPYWDYFDTIPEEDFYGSQVVYFAPESEITSYQNALRNGWFVPDESFLTNHHWRSDWGYELELEYYPGEMFDGYAYIFEDDGTGVFVSSYEGNWRYQDGLLHLDMVNFDDRSQVIRNSFPILQDPFGEGWLEIFSAADGSFFPYLCEDLDSDELMLISSGPLDPYEYALSQGWRLPELWELTDTFWLSVGHYAIELMDNNVPGDNDGWATVYDVGEIGEYILSYKGSWNYEDGMLHLSLVPEREDGYFVDDSFPVLMLDGELWIGRNEYGNALPHFYDDQLADTLEQPKG